MAAKKATGGKRITHSQAIIYLLINILLLPWLGSCLGGRPEWKKQLWLWIAGVICYIIGMALAFTIIGLIIAWLFWLAGFGLFIAAWIWGLMSGIKMIQSNP